MSESMTQQGGGLPPQVLAALLQQRQGGGMPMGVPAGAVPPNMQPMAPPGGGQGPLPRPPPQSGMTPGGPPSTVSIPGAMPAPGAGPRQPGNMQRPTGNAQRPGGNQPPLLGAAKAVAAQGRLGDTTIAHMTPGEVAVPPQVQTPGLKQALDQAFRQAGVNRSQFTAGSPYSATNPMTGAAEYSYWSAILPVVGAVLGSFVPGLGTAAGGAAGAALGGAAGGAAGGIIDHQSPTGIMLSAAGGALGGYMGAPAGAAGAGLNGAGGAALGDAASLAAQSATGAAGSVPGATGKAVADLGASSLGGAAGNSVNPSTLFSGGSGGWTMPTASQLMSRAQTGMYAGMGAGVGGALAPPPQQNNNTLPAGFNKPMDALNTNYGQLLGSNQATAPTFAGYSPYASVVQGQGYRFFPVQS